MANVYGLQPNFSAFCTILVTRCLTLYLEITPPLPVLDVLPTFSKTICLIEFYRMEVRRKCQVTSTLGISHKNRCLHISTEPTRLYHWSFYWKFSSMCISNIWEKGWEKCSDLYVHITRKFVYHSNIWKNTYLLTVEIIYLYKSDPFFHVPCMSN